MPSCCREACPLPKFTQRCKDWGGELLDFNGEADHVHILMSLPPNLDLSRFVNNVIDWSGESSPISVHREPAF
jgi:hypothetical protein